MLFDADIRENFTVEEVNLEKQKLAKWTFTKKLKRWNQRLILDWVNSLSNNKPLEYKLAKSRSLTEVRLLNILEKVFTLLALRH